MSGPYWRPRPSSVGAAAAAPPNRFGAVNLESNAPLDPENLDLDDGELDDGELDHWGPEGNPRFQAVDRSVEGPNPQGRGDRAVLSATPDTVRWGDKAVIRFDKGSGRKSHTTEQLLQVKFMRPMIASLRFTGLILSIEPGAPGSVALEITNLVLHVGVGSSQQRIVKTWWFQPSPLGPLDVTIPNIPVTQLLAEVECVATPGDVQSLVVAYNLAIAPTVHT